MTRAGGVISDCNFARVLQAAFYAFFCPADARFRAAIQHLDLWSISLIARFVKIASLLAAKTC